MGSFFLTGRATQDIFVRMIFLSKILIFTCGTTLGAAPCLFAQGGSEQPTKIERLDQPKAAPPPESNSDELKAQAEEDLRRKQMQRGKREQSLLPPEPLYSLQRQKNLMDDALIPRDRSLMFELAFHLTTVAARDDRRRYVSDPAVHFNLFYRHDAKNHADKIGKWFGFRMAPFTGSGYHKKKFGSYGLTYFGPMIGVGKIGLMPTKETGTTRSNESIAPKIPSASGWLIGAGFAAVSKIGRSTEEDPPTDSDFSTKGATFDGSGFWVEGRYINILYGAVGYNLIVGVQTGRNKEFVYTGIGVTGWD